MKKGCLTAFVIFIVICLLLGMCSSDTTDNSTTDTTYTNATTYASSELTTICTECSSTATTHIHDFHAATCTSPKTCVICSLTDGNPLGHTWMDATCIAPQTCSICNETTGSTIGHSYSDGNCSVCGKADPSDPKNITVWIPTNGGTKYHSNPSCSGMKNPRQTTLAYARNAGYAACKKCN